MLLCSGMVCRSQAPITSNGWAPPKANYNEEYKGLLYPSFDVVTPSGGHITHSSCKGKVTLITFWFEGCTGCREEFSVLNELYDSLKTDTNVVFISLTFDDVHSLSEFAAKYNLYYPIATTGDRDIMLKLNYGMAFPSLVLLDKDMKIVHIGNNNVVKGNNAGRYGLTLSMIISMIHNLE